MERARADLSRAFVLEHFTHGPVSQSLLFDNEHAISMTQDHMQVQFGLSHFTSEDDVKSWKSKNIVISNSVWKTYTFRTPFRFIYEWILTSVL